MFSSYITVPVYANFYRWLGYGEQIEPMVAAWEAGDRQAAAAAAPWELIEDMFIFGTPEQMKERLDAFVAGGITLPILTPIVTPDKLAETIEALAPTKASLSGKGGVAHPTEGGCLSLPGIFACEPRSLADCARAGAPRKYRRSGARPLPRTSSGRRRGLGQLSSAPQFRGSLVGYGLQRTTELASPASV